MNLYESRGKKEKVNNLNKKWKIWKYQSLDMSGRDGCFHYKGSGKIMFFLGIFPKTQLKKSECLQYLPFSPNNVPLPSGRERLWQLFVVLGKSFGFLRVGGYWWVVVPNIGKLYHWSPHPRPDQPSAHKSDTTKISILSDQLQLIGFFPAIKARITKPLLLFKEI